MDDSLDDPQGGAPGGIVSRRELLRGVGVSAMGAVLADTGLMGLASATETGSARVLGPGALPLSLTVNGQARSLRVDPATTLVEALRLRNRAEDLLHDLGLAGLVPSPEQLRRLHAPAGLDLGAEGPEEIALAIMAEAKATLARRAARPLRERPVPIHAREQLLAVE